MSYGFPIHRSIGRDGGRPPHRVSLLLKGEEVGYISFPATDTRFVKDKELFEIAYEQIMRVQNNEGYNRRSQDPKEGGWDSFEVYFCGFRMVGNTEGQRISA